LSIGLRRVPVVSKNGKEASITASYDIDRMPYCRRPLVSRNPKQRQIGSPTAIARPRSRFYRSFDRRITQFHVNENAVGSLELRQRRYFLFFSRRHSSALTLFNPCSKDLPRILRAPAASASASFMTGIRLTTPP